MRKTFRIVCVLMILLVCVSGLFAQTYAANLDEAIRLKSAFITQRIISPKVAVVGYSSASEELSSYIIREIVYAMETSRIPVTVAPLQNVVNVLNSMNLKPSSEITDSAASQAAINLNVDYAIIGSVVHAGGNYRLRTRLINVSIGANINLTEIVIRDSQKVLELLGRLPSDDFESVLQAVPEHSSVVYNIGDTGPAGGIIFYNKGNNTGGWQYLEAAPSDIPWNLAAARSEIRTDGINERAVGSGISNTHAILREAAAMGGGSGWAAHTCDVYEYNGFKDWFLPGRDELNFMYGSLHLKSLGNFRSEAYWTSTASNIGYWFYIDFSNGNHDISHFSTENRVRPIRQF